MADFSRYAVYYAPRPASPLGRFGAAWLGWDAERGEDNAGLELAGLPRPRTELVATPRRYGLHATLKAPIRLADGADFAAFDRAVRDLAAEHAPFDLRLELHDLYEFLALTPDPEQEDARIDAIAADCVTRLDAFRAPPTPEELARRRVGGLSARQEANLLAWGYPYVLDEFTFHVTLTGALAPEDQARASDALHVALGPILAEPPVFEDLCVFGEAADGRFHVLRRHPLGAGAGPP